MQKIWPPSADRDPDHPDSRILDQHSDTTSLCLPEDLAVEGWIGIEIEASWIHLIHSSRAQEVSHSSRRLHFSSFPTSEVDKCYEFIRFLAAQADLPFGEMESPPSQESKVAAAVAVTGSEAIRFRPRLKESLGFDPTMENEIECIARGLHFLINHMPQTICAYTPDTLIDIDPSPNRYPCLLVHIGIGVSFLKVFDDGPSERVGGSSLGSGMLTGLLSMLTNAQTYDEMLENAERGDHTQVDRPIRDIYGADYKTIGFRDTDIASKFGKVFPIRSSDVVAGRKNVHHFEHEHGERVATNAPLAPSTISDADDQQGQKKDRQTEFSEANVSRLLLFAMSNNIGQLACLHSQVYGATDISLGHTSADIGFIIRTLQAAIHYWTGGTKKARFIRPDRYLGALGALLARKE